MLFFEAKMQKFGLSDRMAAVAALVPDGVRACDIGCDHGFVAIYLVREHICPKVIAMDINRGPLLRAREHIESAGLSAYIETRLSDGIKELLPGEAECMIAAGMGGRLIVKILGDHPEKLRTIRYLVLQPQSELSFVRRYLRRMGFVIRKEDMVLEDGKFYPMMLVEGKPFAKEGETFADGETVSEPDPDGETAADRAENNTEPDQAADRAENNAEPDKAADRAENNAKPDKAAEQAENSTEPDEAAYQESLEDEFGPCLIKDRHPVLLEYLDWWEGQQNKILKEVLTYPQRRAQVEEELARIRAVRRRMTGCTGRADAELE